MKSVCADCGTPMSTKAGTIVTGEYGAYKRLCAACIGVETTMQTSEAVDD